MSEALRHSIASGRYRVDADAVAAAMIARAQALRAARRSALVSEMLIPADGIEVRRIAREVEACPLEGAA